jgi:glutathione synthase/RimK-type ligase-like ATP-grasp enzyme
MDKKILEESFNNVGFIVVFMTFSDIDLSKDNYSGKFFIYTSSEGYGYYYKDYIEDIVLALQLQGATILPDYKFLRANNNKVFMEIIRGLSNSSAVKSIESNHFGVYEDVLRRGDWDCKKVIKTAKGAAGRGVFLARDKSDLVKLCKKVSTSKNILKDFKDILRAYRHKGYIKESRYRKKFIIQNFIEGLKNDWRIEVYGSRYYIFYRGVRKNDFRASGSYHFDFNDNLQIPLGILDFAKEIYEDLSLPCLSMDLGYDGQKFYLIEFQGVYFGKIGIAKSKFFYRKEEKNGWIKIFQQLPLEKVYAEAIANFINKTEGMNAGHEFNLQ